MTGANRGSARKDCNVYLKLTHKIPVIFQILKGHDSHLIISEIGKFGFDVSAIPNEL